MTICSAPPTASARWCSTGSARRSSATPSTAPNRAQDLRLTLDAGIQARTEEVLANLAQTYHPKSATAIVMDPRNAEVLAMADWPTFDPSKPSSASPEELRNTATGFTYEPGSTFKAFTVAGALSEHLVTPNTIFDLPTAIQVADRTISDAEERGPESRTVAQILAQSSNVGAVKIGLELGADRFYRWVRRFGFGDPTGVQFPGEERGIVPSSVGVLRARPWATFRSARASR